MAALYPVKLCKAILSGFREQLKLDGIYYPGAVGMHEGIVEDQYIMLVEEDRKVDAYPSNGIDGAILKFDDGQGPFYDDLTKQQLPSDLTKLARRTSI